MFENVSAGFLSPHLIWMKEQQENVTFIAGAHHQSQMYESEDTFKKSQAFQVPWRDRWPCLAPTGFKQAREGFLSDDMHASIYPSVVLLCFLALPLSSRRLFLGCLATSSHIRCLDWVWMHHNTLSAFRCKWTPREKYRRPESCCFIVGSVIRHWSCLFWCWCNI